MCFESNNPRRVLVFVILKVFMLSSVESILEIMSALFAANVWKRPFVLLSIASHIKLFVVEIVESVVVIEFLPLAMSVLIASLVLFSLAMNPSVESLS